MEIITTFPKYSDGEINRALMRELKLGLQLKKETEKARELEAAEEAKVLRGHKTIQGLGKCVATMPEWEFFRLCQKYGQDTVQSKEFMRDYQKRFPHLSPNKI